MEHEFIDNEYVKRVHMLANEFAHKVYKVTANFPKHELYGLTSQLRRSALSVPLNCIEGYARGREKVHKNFLEIAFGSLKEAKYLVTFSLEEGYLAQEDSRELLKCADEIGRMIWGILKNLRNSNV